MHCQTSATSTPCEACQSNQLPGYYYDCKKKRLFKIQTSSFDVPNQAYSQHSLNRAATSATTQNDSLYCRRNTHNVVHLRKQIETGYPLSNSKCVRMLIPMLQKKECKCSLNNPYSPVPPEVVWWTHRSGSVVYALIGETTTQQGIIKCLIGGQLLHDRTYLSTPNNETAIDTHGSDQHNFVFAEPGDCNACCCWNDSGIDYFFSIGDYGIFSWAYCQLLRGRFYFRYVRDQDCLRNYGRDSALACAKQPVGSSLIVGKSKVVLQYDSNTLRHQGKKRLPQKLSSLAFDSEDSNCFYVGTRQCAVYRYDIRTRAGSKAHVDLGKHGFVTSIKPLSHEYSLLMNTSNGSMMKVDKRMDGCVCLVEERRNTVEKRPLKLDDTERYALQALKGQQVKIWSTDNLELLTTISGADGEGRNDNEAPHAEIFTERENLSVLVFGSHESLTMFRF